MTNDKDVHDWAGVVATLQLIIDLLPGGRNNGNYNRIQQKMMIVDPIIKKIVKTHPINKGETATAYGTRLHGLFEKAIDALGDPDINAEVSYLGGVAQKGRPYLLGTKRPDLILGPIDKPWAVIDFKTGVTGLRGVWTKALQNAHLPPGYKGVPIVSWFV